MELVDAGVELFSISLDDFDDKNLYALGYNSQVTQIVNNIRDLSKLVYVNIGTVINSSNILRAEQIIKFILNLGVNDIKISIATNYGTSIPSLKDCYKDYPILNYRVEKFKQMETMRGLCTNDASQCFLVKNDISVCGDKHYSCLVYAREGGEAIGSIHDADWYEQRVSWFESRKHYLNLSSIT